MDGFDFRPMTDADLPDLVRWRGQKHVLPWFRSPVADVAEARERYGPRLRGEKPVRMRVVGYGGRAIGYVQDYRVEVDDEYAVRIQQPGAVCLDYLIGEPDLVGRGIGTAMLRSYVRDVVLEEYPESGHVVASPDHRNVASLRVLDKLGFTQGLWIQPPGEESLEIVCTIERAKVTDW